MKAIVEKLSDNEKKALEPYIEKMKDFQCMMEEGSKGYRKYQKEMWELLRGLREDFFKNTIDASIEFETFELKGFKLDDAESDELKFRKLKEEAVKRQDWDKANEFRNKEREEKEKSIEKAGWKEETNIEKK